MKELHTSGIHWRKHDEPAAAPAISEIYAHLSRGDIAAMVQCLDPQIEWTMAAGFPGGGTYRTPGGVLKLFDRLADLWDNLLVVPAEFFWAGNVAVVLGYYDGVSRRTGKRAVARFAHVWRLLDGRAVWFECIADTRKMQEAIS
ncbi:nuclear transport factor 2 family protein [Sorangium sp. So ce1335]|uniref:nuclear transport factor 2 family protein n=1 Tax=Sorangium sp. So ce1335 TaxID=3133335 RepID=UPI003F630A92